MIRSNLVFSKCISVSFLLNVCSSSTKSQGCRSLPAHRGREVHPGLGRRQSCLPAAERHHCQQSSGGASAAARPGDVQVGPKQSGGETSPPTEDGMRMSPQAWFLCRSEKNKYEICLKTVLKGRCLVSGGSTG